MTCTLNGCSQPSQPRFQKFCSLVHLRQLANRTTAPHTTHTKNGERIFFYSSSHHPENYEFSNFFPKSVCFKRTFHKTAEHAFQAAKFTYSNDPKVTAVYNKILNANTPLEAATIAKNNSKLVDRNWHKKQSSTYTLKEEVMFAIVKDKFTRHPNLRKKLLQTKNIRLVEDSSIDSYWGQGQNHQGENKLGLILMKIRSDMKKRLY